MNLLGETDQSGDSGLRMLIKLIVSVFYVHAMAFKYCKSIVTCAVVIRRFSSVVTNSKTKIWSCNKADYVHFLPKFATSLHAISLGQSNYFHPARSVKFFSFSCYRLL